MKKFIFLISVLFLLCAFKSDDTPTYIYSGYVVTSSGTSEVELQFSDLAVSQIVKTLIYVQVSEDNSGTLQFSSGRTITSDFSTYSAGAKIPLTITNGYYNLRYKASGASQVFSVTH